MSEVEIGNLPWKEFKVMIVKNTTEPGRRKEEQREKLEVSDNKLENLKNNQT